MTSAPLTWDATWGPAVQGVAARVQLSSRVRYLPITAAMVYLNFTVAVFAFGPWWYPALDEFKLYGYLAAAHLCLFLGYAGAARQPARGYRGHLSPRRLLAVAVVIQAALFLPTLLVRTGSALPGLGDAILSPGEAYGRSYIHRQTSLPVVEYIRIALAPLFATLLPLLVTYWKQVSRTTRLLGVGSVAGIAVTYIAMGTNKALADILLVLPFVFTANHFAGRMRFTKWQKLAVLTVFLGAAYLFFLFFSAGMWSRNGSTARYGYIPSARARANWAHPALQAVPAGMEVGVLGAAKYLSSGYFGLGLALEQPFVPMYGVGHSRFLTRQAARLLESNAVLSMPYPERVQAEVGWDALVMWATIYPWLASDLSFAGALVFIFFVGRRLAECWLDTLRGENPWAPVMLAQFIIMVFYISANNQCLQDGEGMVAFWAAYFLWRRSRV
jgi:hypothetical protein